MLLSAQCHGTNTGSDACRRSRVWLESVMEKDSGGLPGGDQHEKKVQWPLLICTAEDNVESSLGAAHDEQ